MNNVGDNKTFKLAGATPTEPLSYVWDWWDNTVTVTSTGTVAKTLTMGGNPSDNYYVRYSSTVVDDIGQSEVFTGSMVVNNPPVVLPGSALLSTNDGTFPFTTNGSVIAYDLEGDNFQFTWYAGGQFLGSGTVYGSYGYTTGTYAGTNVGYREVSSSSINYVVTATGSLTCRIYDLQGGTTAVEFPLYGKAPKATPLSANSASSGLSLDAAGTPFLRIGPGQSAQFSVYTPQQANPITFEWAYFGSNGWSQTAYSTGTTTAFPDGSFQNVDIKSVQTESPGIKIADCFVRDSVTGQISTVQLSVNLTSNNAPVINSATVSPAFPSVGDIIGFVASGSDPDGDLIHYQWAFTGPPLAGQILYGATIYVDTSSLS